MIERLPEQECVGCASCAQICPVGCIQMSEDTEGFWHPSVDTDRCVGCNLCERACPALSTTTVATPTMPEARLAWTTDERDLMAATSGGVFTAIARQVLNDGGAVAGAAYDEDLGVRHIVIESPDDLYRLSRSKYVQSDTSEVIVNVASLLRSNRTVLFCGTACQAYALLAYCRALKVGTEKLLLMDIVCHGVPTPKLLREYLKMLATNGGAISSIAMREREGRGLYGFTSSMRTSFQDGHVFKRDFEHDVFGRVFINRLAERPSCHQCPFKTINRLTDLTLGDCWFSRCLTGDDGTPYEVTLCLVHNDKGLSMLTGCKDLQSVDVDPQKAILANGGMIYSSSKLNLQRTSFLQSLGKRPLDELEREYLPLSLRDKVKRIRSVLKMLARKLAPNVIETRAHKRQQKEYERRIQRTIPRESCAIRTFK